MAHDLTLVDAWHFGSIGQLALGQRFAAAWLGIADTRPLSFLHLADSQPANSRAQTLLYELGFSTPVLGLTAEDFVILGDTGADRVEIGELTPMDGTRWQVSVSGMTRPGVVTLRLPAGAASAVADGAPNVAAFAEETSIVWALHRGVEDLLLYDPLDLEKTFAPFTTSRGSGAVDQPGTVLWMSYLIRPQNTTAQRVGLLRGTGPGYTENAVNVYRSGSTWRLLILATETDTGVPATLHEDHLIVLRVAIGGASSPSTTHVWINPAPALLGGTDPASAAASLSETWREEFDWQSADPTPLADPNGDGVPNFLEFAFGDHPLEAESGSPIVSKLADDYLSISFFRARADLTYLVEGSSDLVEWSLIPHTHAPVGAIQTVTYAEPLTPETPRRLLRVRVVAP